MIHLRTACYAGVLVVSPYIIYLLFRFVSPALYDNERKYATALVSSGYLMFMLGTLLNYLLIFPLTVKFLGTYQVSPDVANMLTIQSYGPDQCADDESVAPPCHRGHSHCGGYHYAYHRCVYALCGGPAYMVAL